MNKERNSSNGGYSQGANRPLNNRLSTQPEEQPASYNTGWRHSQNGPRPNTSYQPHTERGNNRQDVRHEQCEARLQEAAVRTSEISNQLDAAWSRIRELQSELQEVKRQSEQYKHDLKNTKGQIVPLQQQIILLKEAQDRLTSRNQSDRTVRTDNTEMQRRCKQLENKIALLTKQLEQEAAKKASLEKQVNEPTSKNQTTKLEKEVRDLQNKLRGQELQHIQHKNKLIKQKDEQIKRADDVEQKLRESQRTCELFQNELNSGQNGMTPEILRSRVVNHQQQNEQLRKQLHSLQLQLSMESRKLNNRIQELTSQNCRLKEQQEATIARLMMEKLSEQEQCDSLRNRIRQMSQQRGLAPSRR